MQIVLDCVLVTSDSRHIEKRDGVNKMISLKDVEKGFTVIKSGDLLETLNEVLLLGFKADYMEIEDKGESLKIFWKRV